MNLLKKVWKCIYRMLTQDYTKEECTQKEKVDKKVGEFIDMLNKKKKKDFEKKYKEPRDTTSPMEKLYTEKLIGGIQDTPLAKIKPKKKKKKKKMTAKLVSILILGFTVTLCSGCSKNQDIKIVHNYWDKNPSYAERKQEAHLDLYVCKNYKASDKGKTVVYKID